MDITSFTTSPPSPGSTRPGNLYADLQSRTLWLGVDPAVDPAEAVLVSDIVETLHQITLAETRAKAYTDAQIPTRAPLVHTHTSAQVTDFTTAVTGVVMGIPGFNWVQGMILMYSGSLASIGVGGLAGWSLCDGSNGTPDLRDRFIVGAGNKLPGTKNTGSNLVTDTHAGHTHTAAGTALALSQIPSHNHGSITGYVSHDHQHYLSLNSGYESAGHQHGIGDGAGAHIGATGGGNYAPGGSTQILSSGVTANHYHATSGYVGGITQNHYHAIPAEGGGGAHTHTIATDGAHSHAMTPAAIREATPYFALAFIMKL